MRDADREFWHERWANDQLGWHRADTNPLLVRHWPALQMPPGVPVLVPLCGKSLDMRYLESQGHPVIGIDLSERAVLAYFEEAGETASRVELPQLTRYEAARTTLYCGDFFELGAPATSGIRAVYDRAALQALPESVRAKYVHHLLSIIPESAHILLIALEYDQVRIGGPPYSVTAAEVDDLYSPRCRVTCLDRVPLGELPPALVERGAENQIEAVYHIVKEH